MTHNTDPLALVQEVKGAVDGIKAKQGEIDAFLKKMSEEDLAKTDKVAADALAAANAAAEAVKGFADRIVENEQKLFDNINAGKAAPKTLGQLVIETDAFKEFARGTTNRAHMSFDGSVFANTITGQEGSPPANSDVLVAPQRLQGIIPGAFRRLRVRDAIPSGATTSNMIEYTRELTFTNSAAETAEGDTKPESAITFELKTAPVRTIAHWLKLSKQVRDDAPQLQAHIDGRLRYGVELRIDNQLLLGNGTGQNLEGLLIGDNYTSFSPTAGETALDSLNRMKYAVDASDYIATAIMLNPVTWGEIERIKGDDDHYVVGSPLSPIGPFLWGLPVVVTNAMPVGKAHVSALDILAQTFTRENTVVEIFEQDDTNAQQNLLTVRAEARLALAVYTPAASRYGALTSPGASA